MTFPFPLTAISKWGNTSSVVFNPSDKGGNITLSNGNADAVGAGGMWHSVRALTALTLRTWYWEFKIMSGPTGVAAGLIDSGASLTTWTGNSANGVGAINASALYVTGVTRNYATAMPTFAVNDILAFAFNRTAGLLFLHRNGVYFNGGDPGAGTGYVASGLTSGNWFPAAASSDAGSRIRIISDDGSFTYPKPSGYMPYGAASVIVQ